MVKRFFFFLFFFSLSLSYAQDTTKVPLTILYFNDLHAQNLPYKEITSDSTYRMVGGIAYLAGLIDSLRKIIPNTVVLDAGDDFSGTPICTMTKGKSQVELLNLIKPGAITLGNHEFDYGYLNLKQVFYLQSHVVYPYNIDFGDFNYVNTRGFIGSDPKWVVGIISLMTEDLPNLTLKKNIAGLKIENPIEYAKYLAERYEDIIIALTHLGLDADKILADSVPDIDVIIGGHSHTVLKQPVIENGVIICQAGSRGKYLGRLDLVIDTKGDSVYSWKNELILIDPMKITPDKEVTELVEKYETLVDSLLGDTIGELKTPWRKNYKGESNLGNWEADVMCEYAKTDFAFMNSGGLRKDLPAGPITERDIWEINPFSNYLVRFSVMGKELKNIIQHQCTNARELLQISGLSYAYDTSIKKLSEARINGQKIKDGKKYSGATNNYVTDQFEKFFGFTPKEIIEMSDALDRDVFIQAVKKQKVIDSKIEGRINIH